MSSASDPDLIPSEESTCGPRLQSSFETLITTYPPILESLLSHLPTPALLQLYHTSRHLRSFLQSYPTAWNHLSFRLLFASGAQNQPSLHNESREARERQSKPYALDQLLVTLVTPFGTRLKTLDLDNTAVSGCNLTTCVLSPKAGTLEHLSVRGCKNVSLKYHILPFLQLQRAMSAHDVPNAKKKSSTGLPEPIPGLALKSIYTYRCRHHRRRPYFASILKRRESDPEPTHELIELCHEHGIWTDTAWCPTPNGRCVRRKEYHSGHSIQGTFPPNGKEIWVVFDRLWRSGNRIGNPLEAPSAGTQRSTDGCLWEEAEYGHDGEALGTGVGHGQGEGKHVPAHLRASQRVFVEDIRCDACGDEISERCEQCSVRMHCMGCRKTFCASCAFDRPLPEKASKGSCSLHMPLPNDPSGVSLTIPPSSPASLPSSLIAGPTLHSFQAASEPSASLTRTEKAQGDRFWWAPGAKRSPNLLLESSGNEDTDSENENGNAPYLAIASLRIPNNNLKWCCLEPIFSGGGGFAFVGTALSGPGVDRIRTAPLPKRCGFEGLEAPCPEDVELPPEDTSPFGHADHCKYPDPIQYLKGSSGDPWTSIGPRTLCHDCYATEHWKVKCEACNRVLCKDHDLRGLNMRICGYANMTVEKSRIQFHCNEKDGEASFYRPHPSDLVPETPAPSADGDSTPEISPQVRDIAAESLNESAVVWSSSDEDAGPEKPSGGHPRWPSSLWKGCGAYFCPWPWPQGDLRPRCSASLRSCTLCGAWECGDCINAFPPCDCSFCMENFSCPTCYLAHRVRDCRKHIEDEERKLRQRREAIERTIQLEQMKRADELAEQLGEFLVGLVPSQEDDHDEFSLDMTTNVPLEASLEVV